MLMLLGKAWRRMGCLARKHWWLNRQIKVASCWLSQGRVCSLRGTERSLQLRSRTSMGALVRARSTDRENTCDCETCDREEQVARHGTNA